VRTADFWAAAAGVVPFAHKLVDWNPGISCFEDDMIARLGSAPGFHLAEVWLCAEQEQRERMV
jgi:hypothetical protein